MRSVIHDKQSGLAIGGQGKLGRAAEADTLDLAKQTRTRKSLSRCRDDNGRPGCGQAELPADEVLFTVGNPCRKRGTRPRHPRGRSLLTAGPPDA